MIFFERPWILAAMAPWAVVCAVLLLRQQRALLWIATNTGARFRSQLTRYTPTSLILHMVFLFGLGFLGICSAAGPYSTGLVEKEENTGDVAIAIDASFSMAATDVDAAVIQNEDAATGEARPAKKLSRLSAAKAVAAGLIAEMPQYRFALISFSGIPAIHSPATTDHAALVTYLNTLPLHSFRATGSSYAAAFSGILHISQQNGRPFQVLLISDGELPQPDRYSDELAALKKRKARVHTLAVGSSKGSRLTIFNPEDLRSKRSPARAAAKITTRRVDSELKKIASETGGSFNILKKGALEALKAELKRNSGGTALVRAPGRRDHSRIPLAAFLLFFVVETVFLSGGRSAGGPPRGIVPLLALFISLAALTGCGNDLNRAHVRNEQGLALFHLQRHAEARAEFEASAGLRVRDEIPTYNEAGNLLAEQSYSAAHRMYERVIEMNPDIAEAMYNDGQVLYSWGRSELHPKTKGHCRQERTRMLWQQAELRFRRTADHVESGRGLKKDALRNAAFLREQIKELDRFEKLCPSSPNKQSQAKKEQKNSEQEPKQQKPDEKKQSASSGRSPQSNKEADSSKSAGKTGRPEAKGPSGKDGSVTSETKGLTRAEQDQIDGELRRIRDQARAGKKHLQSTAQQMPGGKLPPSKKGKGRGGPAIWW